MEIDGPVLKKKLKKINMRFYQSADDEALWSLRFSAADNAFICPKWLAILRTFLVNHTGASFVKH